MRDETLAGVRQLGSELGQVLGQAGQAAFDAVKLFDNAEIASNFSNLRDSGFGTIQAGVTAFASSVGERIFGGLTDAFSGRNAAGQQLSAGQRVFAGVTGTIDTVGTATGIKAAGVGIKGGFKAGAGIVGGLFGRGADRGLLNPNSIRFSQDSVRGTFSDGRSIHELTEGLSTGRIKPRDVPAVRLVERQGRLISIDNRRLQAFRDAGVDIPTRMATPSEIRKAIRDGKFSAGELGSATIRIRNGR